ncbi:MAG: NgoFVII family restriction endonuclease, partial [Lachnospiraceae bacterium]|nr:NgoFVII family restriction endonuclease [Lachnospiraceae bacterium]
DYYSLHIVKGRYVESELTKIYKDNAKRYDLIYKYYMKYRSERALGFCCSRQHAEKMAEEFCNRGIMSVAVYSNADGEFSEDRDIAIEKLKNREVKVIFSVDMFNEGLDIASLDMVMFLRPTESPVVFLQQLGRGLRTYKGKNYLNVLDFIGNYEHAGRAPLLLGKERSFSDSENKADCYNDMEYPDDCIVDFDIRLIDLFKELDKKSLTVKERINQEYYRVKELLDGKVPTRMDLFTYMEDGLYQYCVKHSKENPFRHYLDYLHGLAELSDDEEELYAEIGKEFLALIETTDMTKVYKMPILYSFYNNGNVRLEITEDEVLTCRKEFFDRNKNWRDFSDSITYEEYKNMTDKQHLMKARTMPIKFLKASGKGFFVDKEGYALAIREDLRDVIKNDAFRAHMNDILEYRTMDYYRRRYEGRYI